MRYIPFIVAVTIFIASCGGGGGGNNSQNNEQNKVTYKSFSLYGTNVSKAVGFEVEFLSNSDNLKVEKETILKNWEIKVKRDNNKIKLIAFNKNLSNIGKDKGALLKIYSEDALIKILNYKVVDDFGNPLNSKLNLK